MREVLFVQGGGPDVHAQWDVHLVESLRRALGAAYEVRYPPMPDEEDPRLDTWVPAIARELARLRPGAVVVGHSVGGTVLLHALADAPPTLGAIVLLAAPYIGEGGWESEEIAPLADLAARLPAGVPVLLYHGDADAEVPVAHVDRYAAALPGARVRRLAGRDHQLDDDLSEVARDLRALFPSRA
ncbi:alpha/beta hydrolase [Roseisolibacter sp. H3M3-2]|uniref:alpha/beta hydrolase n=1 Tax=Roseisolibacter sp. H3M3-2 TaxID=3031323 RepID=UPI0023DA1838|nr:alpha/beta hydrolase [Roseisolibacter sp. H3M3-2]MDF1501829.1 alpha/beta hydrolase [Roseisolibacter sp. H3M3-2]